MASAGSCSLAGLQRGKEPLGADRAAKGTAPAEAGQGGREEARGERAVPLGVSSCSSFVAMKRPCEETTSESDLDETIDVGSENNYPG